MTNKLHISELAQGDLAEIKSYIAEELENPIAALATVTSITKTMRLLIDHALIGSPLSAITGVETDYRYLVSGNYLVFYRPYGSDVYVDRILYGKRDYLQVLFGELSEGDA